MVLVEVAQDNRYVILPQVALSSYFEIFIMYIIQNKF